MVNNPTYASTSAHQENKYVEATRNPLYRGMSDADSPIQHDHNDPEVYEIVQERPLHT